MGLSGLLKRARRHSWQVWVLWGIGAVAMLFLFEAGTLVELTYLLDPELLAGVVLFVGWQLRRHVTTGRLLLYGVGVAVRQRRLARLQRPGSAP